MTAIITIPEADLLAILGENGERWVKGTWGNGEGSVCLHGAILRCQPVLGDAHLIEQVARVRGWGTSWNDDPATSWPMIRARLAHIEVTDADLAVTFGPQWAQIVALVRRAAVLTLDEAKRLNAARDAASAAWNPAANAADAAIAAWYPAAAAADNAARDAAAAAWGAANAAAAAANAPYTAAAWGAALALAVRDLIGQHGFTQAHYDLLTGPWRTVIGPIHPDDAKVAQ